MEWILVFLALGFALGWVVRGGCNEDRKRQRRGAGAVSVDDWRHALQERADAKANAAARRNKRS